MNDEQLRAYEKWKRYVGGGNVDSKLWIVGIEEGGKFDESLFYGIFGNQYRAKLNKYFGEFYIQLDQDYICNSPVWTRTYNILKNLSDDKNINTKLFSSSSAVFLSNIYPLGKPKASGWEYEKAIGLRRNNYINDMAITRSELFPILIKDKIVIFHGKGYWHEAYKILGVNETDFYEGSVTNLRIHKTKKMIFTRHFANGMPNVLLNEISKVVKEWL